MRADIQFLRGVAVLLVVFYHSGIGLFPEGYLGVDIFFVISGFLITGMILKDLEAKQFSFLNFYQRRAKRLLPALYSTLIFTTVLAVFFLTKGQWSDYLAQFKGAVTFSANMVLPGQTGYFEEASEGKPLLHIWSLSLEEQYYFLLPIFLFLLPSSKRIWGLVIISCASLIWCYNWMTSDVQEAPFLWRLGDSEKFEWAFYLLPTRAWELLAGSIAAWIVVYKKPVKLSVSVRFAALFCIVLMSWVGINPSHPGIEAIIVVVATALLLVGKDNWLPANRITNAIQRVGDWSYSIYLVHWPLFCFAFLGYVGQVPWSVSVVLTIASVVLGYLQYQYVEIPFRFKRLSRYFSNWKPAVVATALMIILPFGMASHPLYHGENFDQKRRINDGFGKACEHSLDHQNTVKKACRSGDDVEIIVWGDSYAMHLVPGLSVKNTNIAQVTKSSCGPFPDIAIVNDKLGEAWAKECVDYNRSALDFIKGAANLKYVVLSSPLSLYLADRTKIYTPSGLKEPDPELLVESFNRLSTELMELGITPIFVSPPPKNGRNIGECLERMFGPALMFLDNCAINKSDYFEFQKVERQLLAEFEKRMKVMRLEDFLCDEDVCKTQIDGIFVYRDSGHLSIQGSKYLFKDIVVSEL